MEFEVPFSKLKPIYFHGFVLGLLPRRPPDAPRCPRGAQRRAKDAPRTRQGAPKTYQDATRRHKTPRQRAHDAPKTPQETGKKSPKSAPKRNPLQTLISNRFGVDFGSISVVFWRFLGSIFDGFELHFLKIFTPQEKHQQTQRAKRAKRFRCSRIFF